MSRRMRKKIYQKDGVKIDENTGRQAGNFLFDLETPPEGEKDLSWFESSNLSAKTRVKGPSTMAALSYYDVLAQGFKSRAALIVGNTLKKLLIADNGGGREEAKAVLKGSLPEEIEIPVGRE